MKKILDVACGGKMFYFDKHDDRVLFCDNRKISTTLCDGRRFEIKPDIVCDFTALPFDDNSFRLVVFDPPHLTRCTGKSKYKEIYGSLSEIHTPTGWQQIKYGALYSDWREMLSKGFKECFRVLEPSGILIFKWNETDIKVSEVLALTKEKPIFGHISGKRSNTHWICFMKGGAMTREEFIKIVSEYEGALSEDNRYIKITSNNRIKDYYQDGSVHTDKIVRCEIIFCKEDESVQGAEDTYSIIGGFAFPAPIAEKTLRDKLDKYNFKKAEGRQLNLFDFIPH